MKTNELTGAALDWAVAKCVGLVCDDTPKGLPSNKEYTYKPSTDWSQGGPIIEREGIALDCLRFAGNVQGWVAALPSTTTWEDDAFVEEYPGQTPLIAAMRCYVASKLGDDVAIPEELK